MRETIELPLPVDDRAEDIQPSFGRGVPILILTAQSHIAGVVQDIQPHALSILSQEPVPAESKVAIEFGAVTREAQVVACRPNGGRFELCVIVPEWKARDLRAAERFPITQEVRVSRGGSDRQIDAVIVDLSSRGVGLELGELLEAGEVILLESVSGVAFGTVRHARQLSGERWRAGVEVFHVMPREEMRS